MGDIVERLREVGLCGWQAQQEAADEIERLRALVERLRGAGEELWAWLLVNTFTSQQEYDSFKRVVAQWETARLGAVSHSDGMEGW